MKENEFREINQNPVDEDSILIAVANFT